MPRADAFLTGPLQDDLFSGTRVFERTLPGSGTRVRLRLRPLDGGRVRIEEAARCPAGQARFQAWPEEHGRETDFTRLGFNLAFGEAFAGVSESVGGERPHAGAIG